jgi:GNAT superfamily N-acetyltransferase
MNTIQQCNQLSFRSEVLKRVLPNSVIVQVKTTKDGYDKDLFVATSTKNPKHKAHMSCASGVVKRDGKECPSLYISLLESSHSGEGLGTALIDFAKDYSYEKNCQGNVHLYASTGFEPKKIPHIFYRKCGMGTNSSYKNKKLDFFIKRGKTATDENFKATYMYYPPLNLKGEKIANKVLDFFSNLSDILKPKNMKSSFLNIFKK